MDVLRFIGAVTREVRSVEKDGRPARVVVAACSYDTTIEDLWDCITSPERIPRWFLLVSGDLRLGGRYQLQGNAGGQMIWVRVELTELSDGGAELRLEHTVPVDDHWNQYGPGATGIGWELALMGLSRHVEGHVMPKQPPDTKDLVRRSSDEWCRASIAAGTNEEAARAAAARTTKFYAGV